MGDTFEAEVHALNRSSLVEAAEFDRRHVGSFIGRSSPPATRTSWRPSHRTTNRLLSETQITVRTAGERDLDVVSQDGGLPNLVLRRKVSDGDAFVALRGEEPVGYLRLEWLWSTLPYIEMIWVLEPHRRDGVGRALLTHAETYASGRGHAALYSSSQADEPEPQAWHRRMGFEECGFIAGLNEGGVGEVFFRKALPARTEPS